MHTAAHTKEARSLSINHTIPACCPYVNRKTGTFPAITTARKRGHPEYTISYLFLKLHLINIISWLLHFIKNVCYIDISMKRRDFLKAALGTGFYLTVRRLFPDSLTDYDVGIARGKDYAKATEEAVRLVGGINTYVKPGDIVVVKPNIAFNRPPELKATTDPTIVRTLIHLCFQALASKVYVFDRTCDNPKLTYVNSGIEKAAESAGARVLYVDSVTNKLYKTIAIRGAEVLKDTSVNRYVLESDVFINVPVAKHHSSAGLTLGMKNLMGITGDNRGKWHWHLHESISDINMGVKSHLTIIDATNIMFQNGPTGGRTDYLKRLDTIIASPDIVSADATAARLFDKDPHSIGYIAKGNEKGIGKIEGFTSHTVSL